MIQDRRTAFVQFRFHALVIGMVYPTVPAPVSSQPLRNGVHELDTLSSVLILASV